MSRRWERNNRAASHDAPFICDHCGQTTAAAGGGTRHRSHWPRCLWSLHVDLRAVDRRCGCHGPMEPIAIWVRANGKWAIVHRCARCGMLRSNRIAGDDNELMLLSLAMRPLAQPPFPLDRLLAEVDILDRTHSRTSNEPE